MRKRIYIPLLFLLVTTFIILLMHHQKQGSLLPKAKSETAEFTVGITNVAAVKPKPTNVVQSLVPSTTSQLPMVNDRKKTNEIRQYMEAQNQPVEFYGKVIDQDGNPLSGVKMKGQVLHLKIVVPAAWGTQDEIIPIEKETDLDGRFEVRGLSGRSFGIASIQKDGYEVEPWQHTYGATGGDMGSPVVFKMWSTNIHEQLITGGNRFHIVPDGRPYVIDLTKGTIAETGDGDLKVWVKRPDSITYGKRYDWSCEMGVLNGGLLAAADASMYLAPADGYTPTFKFEQKIGSGWGDSTGEKRFYISLNNGQVYGRITVELFAYYNNGIPGMVRINYVINPSGSRILR